MKEREAETKQRVQLDKREREGGEDKEDICSTINKKRNKQGKKQYNKCRKNRKEFTKRGFLLVAINKQIKQKKKEMEVADQQAKIKRRKRVKKELKKKNSRKGKEKKKKEREGGDKRKDEIN